MLTSKTQLAGTLRASLGSLLSVEFLLRWDLIQGHSTDSDLRHEVSLAFDWGARQTPHHGNLSDVREGVSNRPLKKLLNWRLQGLVGRKITVECRQRIMEAIYLVGPGVRLGIVPLSFAFRRQQCPVEQIANVREDGTCGSASAATSKRREPVRGIAKDPAPSIRKC